MGRGQRRTNWRAWPGSADDEAYRDRVRAYHATAAYRKAIRKRAVWVEPLFAGATLWHRFLRLRLRTLKRVNIGAQLMAAGQNLKRALTEGGRGRAVRPSPHFSAAYRIARDVALSG